MSITRHETAGLLREAATGDIGREGEVWTFRRGSVGRTVRQVELAFRCLAEPVTELRVIEDKLCARLFAAALIERLARKIYGSGRVVGYSVVND
jgi:hypothetical protein